MPRILPLLLAVASVAAACSQPRSAAVPLSTPRWQRITCASAVGSKPEAADALRVSAENWRTDFATHCVPLSEIQSGGPGRDGIPPLDDPRFVAIADAGAWLQPQEPVIAVAEGSVARAYPLQILIWHEIVNDALAGRPIAVTFCPLCNTSLVFERRVGGRELTFGTTGNLRYSDLVMFDRQTESWWQQATGEAIVGALTGERLPRLGSVVLSFEEFATAYPAGEVLSRADADAEMRSKGKTRRHYGTNPYVGYDRADSPPIFWTAADPRIDPRLPPKARVAVATFVDPPVAYVTDDLTGTVAIDTTLGGRAVALLYLGGVASPLDTPATSQGADTGQAILYDRTVDGRTLTLRPAGRMFTDLETGSTWSVAGVATAGPLAGRRLRMLPHEFTFWFVWSTFRPDTQVRRP